MSAEEKNKLPTTQTEAIEEYDKRIKELKKEQAMDQLIGAIGKGAGAAAGLALDLPINVDVENTDFRQQFQAQKERLNALLDTLKERKKDVEKQEKETKRAEKEKQKETARKQEKAEKPRTATATNLLYNLEQADDDDDLQKAAKRAIIHFKGDTRIAEVAHELFTNWSMKGQPQYRKFIKDYVNASPQERKAYEWFLDPANRKSPKWDLVVKQLRKQYPND